MRRTFANAYWTLDERPDGVLLITRTSEVYATIGDITRSFDALLTALAPYRGTSRPLLCDIRAARGRHDDEYVRAASREPQELAKRFVRIAILTRTAAGTLQVRRSLAEAGRRIGVFTSEPDALAFLMSDDRTAP